MNSDVTIRPMPTKFGVGFVAEKPLPDEMTLGYRYEQVGHHHNYHVTPGNWAWPLKYDHWDTAPNWVIDGFSPNMNKTLHVGHLRNLAIANSLSRILKKYKTRFVALLGASLGVTRGAKQGWENWTENVGYKPEVYYDVLMPNDIIEMKRETLPPDESKYVEAVIKDGDQDLRAWVWVNSKGEEVKVKRSDGRPLYAYYDLAFAQEVGPTHYITGHEQKGHFESLGFGEKHLPMGLVLGTDGKKLKSRTGDAMPATEVLGLMIEKLAIPEPKRVWNIAWNILAWNFLHAARATDLKFEVEKWIKPDAPGLYITYTNARLCKALGSIHPAYMWNVGIHGVPLAEEDAKLLGLSAQHDYYWNKAITLMDPSPIANFALELAKALAVAYEKEQIRGGREAFTRTISHCTRVLQDCMSDLGMFRVGEV